MSIGRFEQGVFDQVRDDLGIGLGNKPVSVIRKAFLQRKIVLNNAVVDDHHFSGAVAVGMGVFFSWAAMSSPACVSDAIGTVQGTLLNGLLKISQFTLGPAHL